MIGAKHPGVTFDHYLLELLSLSMTLAEMTKIRFALIHFSSIALNAKAGVGQWPQSEV